MPLDNNGTLLDQLRITAAPTKPGPGGTTQPATLDGPLTATITSGDATVGDAGNPLEVLIVPGSTPGDVTGVVSGDADLGAGVVTISDTFVFHVADVMATNLGISATVEPKP